MNATDDLQRGLNEEQSAASWILYLHQAYNRLFHPDPETFHPNPFTKQMSVDLFTSIKQHHLLGNLARVYGEQALSHPKVLEALAAGLMHPAGRFGFTKSLVKSIKEAHYWVSDHLLVLKINMSDQSISPWLPTCN